MSSISQSQTTAQIGGLPTVGIDIPICSVFLALFVGLAASHMTLLQLNLRKGHKFIFNGMCFGFAMSRILACTMRIVWARQPSNADVALVASVFLNAGILLVYIINVLFAWRMVRASYPSFGWNPIARALNKVLLWAVLGFILPLIVIIVLRVKKPTLAGITTASTVLSRLANTYFLIIALAAPVLLALAIVKSRRGKTVQDPFGEGSWNGKIIVLSTAIVLALIEAGFRCGTSWAPARLASDPAWWDSKAAFYCFNFMIDVMILTLFLVGRIDRRFHVPNKADGPGSYSRAVRVQESDTEGK